MARPKSEDKKQALLEAATQAIAQSGIAASTAVIARNAGVAEGTLFRYFATKDELINTLYLHLKQDLCQSMIMELDRSITDAKMMTRFIWNSYISWGLNHPARHRAIRQLAVSEKLTKETEQRADDMFPELRDLCHRSVLMVFMSDEYRAFGDGLFLALAETTMDFAARDPARAGEYIALGFEAMWRALTIAIPISMLAQTLGVLVRVVNARFGHMADRYAAQGNTRMVAVMHLGGPTLLYFLSGFLPVFFAILLGSAAVTWFLDAIPAFITNGLVVASKILPALGFALLISMMLSSKLMPYLGLGFLIAAYTKLDIIAIALFAVVLAFIISQFLNTSQQEG